MSTAAAGAPARGARTVTPRLRRPRWRAYLLLARVSNLPTVWSNTLAGAAAAGVVAGPEAVAGVAVAASLFYTGGMFLNDAFDAEFDAAHRPERPIPARDVPLSEAFAVGTACLLVAELLLARSALTLGLGALLAAAIVFYDSRHKGVAWAPVVMGACRGLVYAIAASSISGSVPPAAVVGAAMMTAYVSLLTVVARRAGASARWLVPMLIAGISLLDAAFIAAVSANWMLAAVAALGFPLTLFLQRFVPGD
jgi:4-hydroxybenzoate polyprenyltransferase